MIAKNALRAAPLEKRERIRDNIRRNRYCYVCIAPFFLLFFLFTVVPVIAAIGLSFTYYNILQPPSFVGLGNYAKMLFADDVFIKAAMNTLVMAITVGPIGYLGALVLAWMINELSGALRTLLVLLIYAPSISGNIYVIWSIIFNADAYGYANGLLMNAGLIDTPIEWFTNTDYMMPIIIIVALWMSMGAGFLSYVAGFKGLDVSLFEAGMIDGIKNRWQELWYITLPQLKPQMLFGAVMSITSAFSIGDVTVALCGNPSTDYEVHTILNHLADYGSTRFDMGYASAISTVLFLAMILCNLLIRRLLKNVGT